MTGSLIAFVSGAIIISLLVVFESALNVGLNAAVQLPQLPTSVLGGRVLRIGGCGRAGAVWHLDGEGT